MRRRIEDYEMQVSEINNALHHSQQEISSLQEQLATRELDIAELKSDLNRITSQKIVRDMNHPQVNEERMQIPGSEKGRFLAASAQDTKLLKFGSRLSGQEQHLFKKSRHFVGEQNHFANLRPQSAGGQRRPIRGSSYFNSSGRVHILKLTRCPPMFPLTTHTHI